MRQGTSILIVLLTAGAWPACAFAQEEERPVRVDQAIFAPLPVSVELVGTIHARRESSLSTKVEGWVEHLEVDAGSKVKAGQALLRLDATLAEIRRDRILEDLKAAQAELEDARRRLEETRALAARGGVPESEFESRKSQVRVREAQLNQLELALREQREIVTRHTLTAPYGGIISQRHAQVGEWVQPGSSVLELVESDFHYFDLQAPQDLFPLLSEKTRAEVRLDLNRDLTHPATIAVLVPYKDTNTRTFLVRLIVDSPGDALLPGTSGRARLFIGGSIPRVSVPGDALVRQPDGSFVVWVLTTSGSQNRAELRTVQVGQRADARVEILSGIEEGETVIVRGNENLVPGQPVRVVSDPQDSA